MKSTAMRPNEYLVHPNVEYVESSSSTGRWWWTTPEPGTWNNDKTVWTAFDPDSMFRQNRATYLNTTLKTSISSRARRLAERVFAKVELESSVLLNGLKEGSWEIRAKVFCSCTIFRRINLDAVTDENLNLIADTKAPRAIARKYTKHGTVDFSEPIKCPYLSDKNMAYSVTRTNIDGNAVDSNEAINEVSDNYLVSHYDFECSRKTSTVETLG